MAKDFFITETFDLPYKFKFYRIVFPQSEELKVSHPEEELSLIVVEV